MYRKMASSASVGLCHGRRQIISALIVLKKASTAGLSWQLPLPLIDTRNSCRRRGFWYSCEQYCAVSSGLRNGSRLEVVMTNDTRASGRSTRRKLSSPGRPRAALRSGQITFWQRIKQGVSSEEAGMQAGASAPVGSRWFREAGGLPPSKFANAPASLSGRYLSFLNVKRSRCTERKALASV